jgi:hypothetical protein
MRRQKSGLGQGAAAGVESLADLLMDVYDHDAQEQTCSKYRIRVALGSSFSPLGMP